MKIKLGKRKCIILILSNDCVTDIHCFVAHIVTSFVLTLNHSQKLLKIPTRKIPNLLPYNIKKNKE